ncbi:MAG: peptidoglycan DD-metalloendopeptidase family protein [Nitrosomonas sp.]|nr:peptidoglycan DD-metalloendopeptidase family protein [Nitrosomonas sp.]
MYYQPYLPPKKSSILSQKRTRWLTLLLSMPILGMVTAFGIMPDASFQKASEERVVYPLTLPENLATSDPDMTFWHQESIRRGDTIHAILDRLNISRQDKLDILNTSRTSEALHKLKPGEIVHAETRPDGGLLLLRYFYGNGKQLQIEKVDGVFELNELSSQHDNTTLQISSGVITHSLFAAVSDVGLPSQIASQMIDIFASNIDFHRGLHKGDHFTVIYESHQDESGQTQPGRILAVEFSNKGKPYRAIYFKAEGQGDYYTPSGDNLHKPFLMAPLKFSRISSGYTDNRYHPILKRWRAHKGIDYAAPAGTEIMATADGSVKYKGQQAGYGNLIVLQHAGPYSSAYGHLSSFVSHLKPGQRVKQGDIIGYVGSTGMATGPHLHYELRVNGIQQDPTKIVMPAAPSINKKYRAAFQKQSREMLAILELPHNTEMASLQ